MPLLDTRQLRLLASGKPMALAVHADIAGLLDARLRVTGSVGITRREESYSISPEQQQVLRGQRPERPGIPSLLPTPPERTAAWAPPPPAAEHAAAGADGFANEGGAVAQQQQQQVQELEQVGGGAEYAHQQQEWDAAQAYDTADADGGGYSYGEQQSSWEQQTQQPDASNAAEGWGQTAGDWTEQQATAGTEGWAGAEAGGAEGWAGAEVGVAKDWQTQQAATDDAGWSQQAGYEQQGWDQQQQQQYYQQGWEQQQDAEGGAAAEGWASGEAGGTGAWPTCEVGAVEGWAGGNAYPQEEQGQAATPVEEAAPATEPAYGAADIGTGHSAGAVETAVPPQDAGMPPTSSQWGPPGALDT